MEVWKLFLTLPPRKQEMIEGEDRIRELRTKKRLKLQDKKASSQEENPGIGQKRYQMPQGNEVH